jgi:acetylornithine and succinylornithine aminotransferases
MPHVMNTYGRLPIALERGQGVRVWDTQGHEYLDALAGIAVSTLGHAHPRLVAAISDQAGKLIHCSNYYQMPLQEDVASLLVKHSGLTNAFFCNSGLEANEACIKIARKYGVDKGIEKPAIIVFEHAFHGRSLATLAATGNEKVRTGFGPLPEGFIRIPISDLDALQNAVKSNANVVAVMMEVIQGEGGIRPCDTVFLQNVRTICDQNDLLMITDEIQCGFGRTGKWFAWQWADIKPDVMSLAKGLASGVPVGAVVCGPRTANVLQPGNHGTTFGGNPLAMRAAKETILVMEDDNLLENTRQMGEYLKTALQSAFQNISAVKEIRGQGLMIGIELDRPCGALIERAALEQRLLISVTANSVIRLLPALTLTQAEADDIVKRLTLLIHDFLKTA